MTKHRPGSADMRAQAKAAREKALKAEARRTKMIMFGVVGVVVLLAGLVVFQLKSQAPDSSELVYPRGTTDYSLVVPGGEAKPNAMKLNVHVDYACPHCKEFEGANGANLKQWVSEGEVTLAYNLRAFVSANYSVRAANAAACVYDENPKNFVAYTEALFAAQSPAGFTDAQLMDLARTAGATDAIASCVSSAKFKPWVEAADAAGSEVANGTPTVFVNGTKLTDELNYQSTTDASVLKGIVDKALAGPAA